MAFDVHALRDAQTDATPAAAPGTQHTPSGPGIDHAQAQHAHAAASLPTSLPSVPHWLRAMLPAPDLPDVRKQPDFTAQLAQQRAALHPAKTPEPALENARWTPQRLNELAGQVQGLRQQVRANRLPLQAAQQRAMEALDAMQQRALDGRPAGPVDRARHGERVRVVLQALMPPLERLKLSVDAERDGAQRLRLTQRLETSRRGEWKGLGATAPDTPSLKGLNVSTLIQSTDRLATAKAHNENGLPLVVKTPLLSAALDDLEQEVRMHQHMLEAMGGVAHPQLVRLYGVIDAHDHTAQFPAKTWMLVMEGLGGPDGSRLTRALDHAYEAGDITMAQHHGALLYLQDSLADVLDWLHEAGLAHNDFKPQNFVLDDSGLPVLIDFGLASEIGESVPGFTAAYAPPERFSRTGDGDATDAADAYGIGVSLQELSSTSILRMPGYAVNEQTGQREYPQRPKVVTPLEKLLADLTVPEPDKRLTTLAARLSDAACDRAIPDHEARAVLRQAVASARRAGVIPA